MPNDRPILVSACLLGLHTRYDATGKLDSELIKRLAGRCIVPVCPEQLGGLPTPRPPSRFRGGDGADLLAGKATLVNKDGDDMSAAFVRGAQEVLELARLLGAEEAFLKSRSPACGFGQVYIDDDLARGNGVCTALLLQNGIRVHSVD